jgi:hypothetical protein
MGEPLGIEQLFTDIIKFDKYYDSTYYAKKNGIVYGYPDSSLRPNDTIKRAEAFVIAGRVLSFAGLGMESGNVTLETMFTDYDKIPQYAEASITALVNLGIVNGFEDRTLRPDSLITVGESMWIIVKIFNLIKTSDTIADNQNSLKTKPALENGYYKIETSIEETDIDHFISLGSVYRIIITPAYPNKAFEIEGEDMLTIIRLLRGFNVFINNTKSDDPDSGCASLGITLCCTDGTLRNLSMINDVIIDLDSKTPHYLRLYHNDADALNHEINNVRLKKYRQSGLTTIRGEVIENVESMKSNKTIYTATIKRENGDYVSFESSTEIVQIKPNGWMILQPRNFIEAYFRNDSKENAEIIFVLDT